MKKLALALTFVFAIAMVAPAFAEQKPVAKKETVKKTDCSATCKKEAKTACCKAGEAAACKGKKADVKE